MKANAMLSHLLATVAAVAAETPVTYDGHKVFRIPVLDGGSYVQRLVDQLHLEVWHCYLPGSVIEWLRVDVCPIARERVR